MELIIVLVSADLSLCSHLSELGELICARLPCYIHRYYAEKEERGIRQTRVKEMRERVRYSVMSSWTTQI